MAQPAKQFIARRFLVAGETPASRHLIGDALSSVGVQNVILCSSATELYQALKNDSWDQIMAPLFIGESVNMFHVLHLLSKSPNQPKPHFSLLMSEAEEKYIPSAFQMGALSCHSKIYSHTSLVGEFEKLAKTFQHCKGMAPLISGEYLWNYLRKIKDHQNAFQLTTALLDLFPGDPSLLMMLGETQLIAGKVSEARSTIKRAMLIDENLTKRADALLSSIKENSANDESPAPLNLLGIKNCVIIDPDSSVLGFLQQIFTELGVPEIHIFEDANEAWDWLTSHSEPDLIAQEWKLSQNMSGPMLVQKIRSHGFHNVPIHVMSSVIRPQETPLIREFGIDSIIAKPFQRQAFLKTLILGLQQNKMPSEQRSYELKIRKLLSAKKFEEAERLREIYFQQPKLRDGHKNLILAEFAYARDRFSDARNLAMEALKDSGDSLLALGILGRSLLQLKDHAAAMQVFERANSISPSNIDHLCNLALCQYEAGLKEEADRSVERARQVDNKNQKLSEIECHIAIADGNKKKAMRLMSELPQIKNVIAFLNNRSVTLTRGGKFEDGINLYKRALSILPPEWESMKPLIAYNLGLACAKYGDYDQALKSLKIASAGEDSRVANKARSLIKRVGLAVTGAQKLEFNESVDPPELEHTSLAEELGRHFTNNIQLSAEHCLDGIVSNSMGLDKDVIAFLESIPEFLTRVSERKGPSA